MTGYIEAKNHKICCPDCGSWRAPLVYDHTTKDHLFICSFCECNFTVRLNTRRTIIDRASSGTLSHERQTTIPSLPREVGKHGFGQGNQRTSNTYH